MGFPILWTIQSLLLYVIYIKSANSVKSRLINFKLANDINIEHLKIQMRQLVPVMIVISGCKEKIWLNQSDFDPIPVTYTRCNLSTEKIDCYEAVQMLKFIIENRDNPKAQKFIFIHNHLTSWHYRKPVTTVVKNLITKESFKNRDYGGIYRTCWHYDVPWNRYIPYKQMFDEYYKGTDLYMFKQAYRGSFPCCSTFYVNSTLFKTRTIEFYEDLIRYLRNFSINFDSYSKKYRLKNNAGYYCGRFVEYLWHVFLTNQTVIPSDGIV